MRIFRLWVFGLYAAANAGVVAGQGFAALVSPPRFELNARAGETVRQVLQVSNRATAPADYLFRTADWNLDEHFGVHFLDPLQPDTCRPWVSLERPEVVLQGGATLHYRFEVAIPRDAPAGECRFGVLLESKEPDIATPAGIRLPVAGRIGVIVYIKVGAAAPELELLGPKILNLNGRDIPTLRIHNSGTAHARLSGFLTGRDSRDIRYDFNPSDFPILPGEVADIYLMPSTASDDQPKLSFPVRVTGTLEWGNQRTDLDEIFE